MALTAQQSEELATNASFMQRLMQQGAILGHTAQGTDISALTDDEKLRFLRRALRFERGNGIAEAFIKRIAPSVIGSSAVQAATNADASDVSDSDLRAAMQVVITAVNTYEDLSGLEIL